LSDILKKMISQNLHAINLTLSAKTATFT